MPTEPEIYQALSEIFQDVFLRDVPLRPELTARDVAGWDSFKQIEIVMAVEERFAIRLTTRELDSLQSVGDLVRVVAAKLPH
jgi:acyl carrier protein